MITANKSAVTYPNQNALCAAGVVAQHEPKLCTADIVTALSRAYQRGTHTIGRVVITHTGYVSNPECYDAATATYRLTIGRVC